MYQKCLDFYYLIVSYSEKMWKGIWKDVLVSSVKKEDSPNSSGPVVFEKCSNVNEDDHNIVFVSTNRNPEFVNA